MDSDRPATIVTDFMEANAAATAAFDGNMSFINDDFDMKGCFTNVPTGETQMAVEWLVQTCISRGLHDIWSPHSLRSTLPPQLSPAPRTHLRIPLTCIPTYTMRHNTDVYSTFGTMLQRQTQGLPMGSAFSVFLQRCWCTWREAMYTLYYTPQDTSRTHRHIVLHIHDHTAILLEHRYVDDVSQIALFKHDTPPHTIQLLRDILEHRRQCRYQQILHDGGITWGAGDELTFIGLQKTFCPHTGLHLSPRMVHTMQLYDDNEQDYTIKSLPPHNDSWCRRTQLYATIAGMLTRCSTLCTDDALGISAAAWGFYIMHHFADVPWPLLHLHCRKWQARPSHAHFAATHALAMAENRPAGLIAP
jgi:hypothetical protein